MSLKDDYFRADGNHDIGFQNKWKGTSIPYSYGASMHGTIIGLRGFGGGPEEPMQENAYLQHAGVVGRSNDVFGVSGASGRSPGVYGQTGDLPTGLNFQAGVFGAAETQPGVIGSSNSGDGVQGASFTGTAISAYSFHGPAMHGLSRGGSGVIGISGVQGPPLPDRPMTGGAVGTSDSLPGVIGTSSSIGMYAFSSNAGILAQTTNPASFAGYFAGNVNVTEALTALVKNAVVAFPDGTRRLLHCMESPEHWFEDFGAAKLKNGRAVVKLDGDFAKVIKRVDYHVFLTPKGDCGGLYVAHRGDAAFEVRELRGGKSGVAFCYRIVGRRADIKAHRRFAKFDASVPRPPAKARPPIGPTAATQSALEVEMERLARERTQVGATTGKRERARRV